jgi:hypothetical protein
VRLTARALPDTFMVFAFVVRIRRSAQTFAGSEFGGCLCAGRAWGAPGMAH